MLIAPVLFENSGVSGETNSKILQEPMRSSDLSCQGCHGSQLGFRTRTENYSLLLGRPCNKRGTKNDTVNIQRMTISVITCPSRIRVRSKLQGARAREENATRESENIVFVGNDWHTGVLPCYLKSIYQAKGIHVNAKVVFCVHNIAYQGRFARADFELLNLPDSFLPSFDFIDGHIKPVVGRKTNSMKAGITECDLFMTVSPHYVKELISGADKGVELHGVLRTKPLEV
uniref:Starch synthase catalytic domain-containing protein n=1 Tax=Oryza brachyantha TaxID=4533 RepID=J3KTZ7_ORYBR